MSYRVPANVRTSLRSTCRFHVITTWGSHCYSMRNSYGLYISTMNVMRIENLVLNFIATSHSRKCIKKNKVILYLPPWFVLFFLPLSFLLCMTNVLLSVNRNWCYYFVRYDKSIAMPAWGYATRIKLIISFIEKVCLHSHTVFDA